MTRILAPSRDSVTHILSVSDSVTSITLHAVTRTSGQCLYVPLVYVVIGI